MKKSDVFVYIAGKYTDKDMLNTELNIAKAQEIAIFMANNNVFYFCPHTHSRLMDYYAPEVSWKYWMAVDIKVIEDLCNCLIMVDNYQDSKGSLLEEAKAIELGYPVFYSVKEFFNWYRKLKD